jgi:hypothetical protein
MSLDWTFRADFSGGTVAVPPDILQQITRHAEAFRRRLGKLRTCSCSCSIRILRACLSCIDRPLKTARRLADACFTRSLTPSLFAIYYHLLGYQPWYKLKMYVEMFLRSSRSAVDTHISQFRTDFRAACCPSGVAPNGGYARETVVGDRDAA